MARFLLFTLFNLFLTSQFFSAFGSDVSSGTLQLSGMIPEIFSLQVRGVPGDLDFSPKAIVNNRTLGLIHLKYNIPLDRFEIKSNTTSGLPENSNGTPVPLSTPMSYVVTCASAVSSPTTATEIAAGADIKSLATGLSNGYGIEEDCILTSSWVGTSLHLPVAGIYTEIIIITLSSN